VSSSRILPAYINGSIQDIMPDQSRQFNS
jgi:hypothetical protein